MKQIIFGFLSLITLFLAHSPAHAQVNSAGELLRGGVEDSNLLLKEYLRPYANGFSAGLNTGWNQSASPHKTLGFSFRVNATLAFVPSSDEFFDIERLQPQFRQLELLSPSGVTPTVAGDDVTGATVGRRFINPSTQQEEELFSFQLPGGTGYPLVPSPVVQASLGLPVDSEISVRYVPPVSSGNVDGSVSLYGIGIKHGLNQWFPGGGALPVDLSIQLGYTQFNFDIDTDVQPESGSDIRNDFSAEEWEDQTIELQTSGFVGNLLVGRNFPFISLFAGAGFQSSTSDIITKGSYPITAPNANYDPSTSPETKAIEPIRDPFNISIDGENTIHALAGFRIRLGILALSGSYTIADYPVANVGIGLSFR